MSEFSRAACSTSSRSWSNDSARSSTEVPGPTTQAAAKRAVSAAARSGTAGLRTAAAGSGPPASRTERRPRGTGSDIGNARAPRSGRASQQPRLLNDSAGTGMSCVRNRKRRQCECGIGRAIPRRPGPQGPSHQEFTALATVARNPGTVLAPDVAFVRRERIPASGPPAAFWEGAPGFGGGGHVARRYPAPRRRRGRGCGSRPARAWSGSWNPRRGADGAPRLPAFCLPVADIFA